MEHEVTISSYWGLQGAPTMWNGVTILPGWGQNYCSTSLSQHAKVVQPDLVITLGDIWVMDPGLLREMPVAHWLPVDTRPQSLADRNCVEASGAQLIAMSKWGRDRMISAGYNPVYVPHGIDTELFKPPADRKEVRGKLSVDDYFVIGMNAANNDAIRKAAPEVMLAFAKFHETHPDAILSLHTGVHQEGGQDLEALAENLGIVDLVRVVDQYRYACGLVTPEDLAEWYGVLDVLCATTFAEGFGLPIIEAQACGTPVITTDASAMTELNPHGLHVGGEPFWNGVHKGWWTKPYIGQIVAAFERAYEDRDKVQRDKLREFALGYDLDLVSGKYMEPAIDELAERMKKRG
jgi:glycosyltransferase involved in cell wall biosynthesis